MTWRFILMPLLKTIRGLTRRSKLLLAWDVFMVWVATINLTLILFDLTYLWLRPIYFNHIPVVACQGLTNRRHSQACHRSPTR